MLASFIIKDNGISSDTDDVVNLLTEIGLLERNEAPGRKVGFITS